MPWNKNDFLGHFIKFLNILLHKAVFLKTFFLFFRTFVNLRTSNIIIIRCHARLTASTQRTKQMFVAKYLFCTFAV